MTAAQYRDALKNLGISQRDAAKIFEINERTSRRYALGQTNIPENVKKRLLTMLERQQRPN